MVDMAVATVPTASEMATELTKRVKELEDDVAKLTRELDDTLSELQETQDDLTVAGDRADEAESEARVATREAEIATTRLAELTASLERYVWLDDQPARPTYCRQCGRTRPLHKVDCVFGMVS